MNPKWADRKSGGLGRMQWLTWTSHVLHHSGSLLGVIELIVLCAFICMEEYFNAQMRETLLYK